MNEVSHGSLRPEEPDTYIIDPVKAEYIAYAEKPYRDEAVILGQIIERANIGAKTGDTDGETGRYKKYYGDHLHMAREFALTNANNIGCEAAQAYDQFVAAKILLKGLTGGSPVGASSEDVK